MLKRALVLALLTLSLTACGGDSSETTAPATDNSGATDTGNTDAGSTDGGSTDGGSTDGGSTDGGSTDGGSTDGGSTDGGSTDGGSTDGGSTDGGNTDGGSQTSQPILSPATSINLGRSLNVLILSSHTTDQRALRQEEIDTSFNLVKQILNYNQVVNTYQVTYASYDTSLSSVQMVDFYNENAGQGSYPETYMLAKSSWIQEQQNIELMNKADIVVLRTSFDSDITKGGFWGAAAGEVIGWPNLAKIESLRKDIVILNSPIDPESTRYPYQHNQYLSEQLKISRFDRIFAHEFIHALGYGAHDNGVDVYQTEAFSTRIKNDLAYGQTVGSTLEYGDCFSVMGNSDCSLMLSPSAKEYLGVKLDFVSAYETGEVTLAKGQLLKTLLEQTTENDGHEQVLTYVTLEPPMLDKYGQSLNGDLEVEGGQHNLKANMDGYLVRIVKVNVTIEGTPSVILVDANPPINNATYTLQAGHSIEIAGKMKIDFTASNNDSAVFQITYQ